MGAKKKPLWGTCIGIYAGQYYDSETGLHYNYHRYYDPQLGRYLRSDPLDISSAIIKLKSEMRGLRNKAEKFTFDKLMLSYFLHPETLDPYSYAYNNPLMFIDMYGLSAKNVKEWRDRFEKYKDLLDACKGDMKDYDNCRKCCKAIAHIGLEGDANGWWMPFETCHAAMCEDCL